jgi:hypothetical protein
MCRRVCSQEACPSKFCDEQHLRASPRVTESMRRGVDSPLLRDPRILGILIALVAGAVVCLGGIKLLATISALAWLAALSYRWPLVVAGLALLQSVDFFRFLPPNALLTVPISAGLSFTLLDVLVLVSLPLALLRLAKRSERPLFGLPVLLLISATTLSVVAGVVFGGTGLDAGIALFRGVFYYVMYLWLESTRPAS